MKSHIILYSVFISVSAVQINHKSPVEDILKHSKEVMTTMGEWELIGLSVRKFQQPTTTTTGKQEFYEELRFFVRKHGFINLPNRKDGFTFHVIKYVSQ